MIGLNHHLVGRGAVPSTRLFPAGSLSARNCRRLCRLWQVRLSPNKATPCRLSQSLGLADSVLQIWQARKAVREEIASAERAASSRLAADRGRK